jgi:hypothetical protein
MRTGLALCVVAALSIATSATSCGRSSSSGSSEAAAKADAETIQGLLPGIEAAQGLARPAPEPPAESEGGFPTANTVGTWNVADLPPTPDDMMALHGDGNGYARFPPSGGYIQDLYGSEGLLAFVELRAASDGWGEYQTQLWAYPTLSTEVWRGLEQYRLDGGTWDNLIAGPAGQIFERLASFNFDGSSEDRTLVWSRNWVDEAGSQVFETSYFDIPADFNDPAFDYPAAIVPPAKVPVPLTDGNSYAAHSEGTMAFPSSSAPTAAATTEFYNQVPNGGGSGVLKHWKSFGTVARNRGPWRSDARTVSIAFEDSSGARTERSKEIVVYSTPIGTAYTSTSTRATDIGLLADGRASYLSEIRVGYSVAFSQQLRTVISLAETAIDSAEFTGTLTIFAGTRLRAEYRATLDAQNGLQVFSTRSKTLVSFPLHLVTHLVDAPIGPPLSKILFLENGGSFVGELINGVLQGIYTDRNGREHGLTVSQTSIDLDGVLADPPGKGKGKP